MHKKFNKHLAAILILLAALGCTIERQENLTPPRVNPWNSVRNITQRAMNAEMILDYDLLCPKIKNSTNCIDKIFINNKTKLAPIFNFNLPSPSLSTLYPLTRNAGLKAQDILNEHNLLMTTLDTCLSHGDLRPPKPTPSNSREWSKFTAYRGYIPMMARCALDLHSNKILNFSRNFRLLTHYLSETCRCSPPIPILPYATGPFYRNTSFINNYIKSRNQNIFFYTSFLNSLNNLPNFPETLKTSTNIQLICGIEDIKNQKTRNKDQLFIVLHYLISLYGFFETPFTDGQNQQKAFNDLDNELTKDNTLIGAFHILYSPPAFLYTKIYQAQRDLERARIMTALAIYYKTHDNYPDTLDQLAPGILKQVPSNPMTDKPFNYTLLPNGEYELSDE